MFKNGEGRNRTADAEIFSLSLYRLSYLAQLLNFSIMRLSFKVNYLFVDGNRYYSLGS